MFELLAQRKQVKQAVVGGLGLVLLAGCSSEAKNVEPSPAPKTDEIITCTPHGNGALSIPDSFDMVKAAATLDVSPAQVLNGLGGLATCDRPVSAADVDDYSAVVRINGQGVKCLAIAFQKDPAIYQEQVDIVAVCPAGK